MKFLTTWSVHSNSHNEVRTRFLEGGAQPPKGITTIGRWHYADGSGGVHVFECDDVQAITEFAAEWSDLLTVQVKPVVEDAQMGSALSKVMATRK